MWTAIGTRDAKNRLSELIRQVQQGQRFTITNRGEPVAQLVPIDAPKTTDTAAAIDAFLAFKSAHPVKQRVNVQELIEDGRA
jgi:prevent-host-death family protein